MDVRSLLRGRAPGLVAGLVAYVVVAVTVVGVVVLAALAPEQRVALGTALRGQVAPLVLGAVLALAGLALLLWRAIVPYVKTARRLTGDVRLLLRANPDHRLDRSGPPELAELAAAVDELAERRRTAEREVEQQVRAARADLDKERNRLAALMADLTVAVLVCSRGGRVLLYNAAAQTLLGDDPALGLGRSVFGLVDRGLVTHALDLIEESSLDTHVSTTLRDGQLLQVRLAPVRAEEGGSGFVLVLEDMTDQVQARRHRDALLRGLTENTRASLASIRAAVETVLDYPDMEPEERRQFVDIIRDESERLGGQVEGWAAEAGSLGGDWFLSEMSGDDLLQVLGRELGREVDVTTCPAQEVAPVWLRVDSHAVARALGHLAGRLREKSGVERLELTLGPAGRHARLELRWPGRAPDADVFRGWLDEPLSGGAGASVQDVVERHDAEVWTGADGSRPGGWAHLRLLLPQTGSAPRSRPQAPRHSRPEFYDFDLFDHAEEALAWHDRALADLAYTVFDTETTGFHPDQGDEIIALGAVRVGNGRLRRSETFERLVDPGRRVPAASSAVHGITTEMVQGQPRLEEVLPLFARFADGTVLVGHNVGFDMSFFRAREERTGVHFAQPVLDTLLLDAALHPDHDQHSLEAIAARLGVDVIGRHTALGDALLTGEVFVRLLALLQQRGTTTVGQALEASRETYQARLDATLYGS